MKSLCVALVCFFMALHGAHAQPAGARIIDNVDRCVQIKSSPRNLSPGYERPFVTNTCSFPVQAIGCWEIVDARGEVNQSFPDSCSGSGIAYVGSVTPGYPAAAAVLPPGWANGTAAGSKMPFRVREGFVVACPVKDPSDSSRWVHMRNLVRDRTGALTVNCSSETSPPRSEYGATIFVSSTGSAGAPARAAPPGPPAQPNSRSEPEQVAKARLPDAASPAPARPAAAADTAHYFLQTGSFFTREEANSQSDKLKAGNLPASLLVGEMLGKPIYRVRIGPFRDKALADSIKDRLAATAPDAVVLRVQGEPRNTAYVDDAVGRTR